MGKAKKQRSQLVKAKGTSEKQPGTHKAFKVSQRKATKAKHKAKVVSTNLKRINFQNRQQTSNINNIFTDIQHSKLTSTNVKEKTPTLTKKASKTAETRQADMDEATRQMAVL